jgi:hypothetical protein
MINPLAEAETSMFDPSPAAGPDDPSVTGLDKTEHRSSPGGKFKRCKVVIFVAEPGRETENA